MRRRYSLFARLLLCSALSFISSIALAAGPAKGAGGGLIVNIDNPNFRKLVMALPELRAIPESDAELVKLAKEGPAELGRLLTFSGFFSVMDANAYVDLMKKIDAAAAAQQGLTGIDLPGWKGVGAEALTIGALTREGGEITIELRTADVHQAKIVLGKKYSRVTAAQFKKVMATYADRLLEAYTGRPGIFSSRLVFVGRPGKGGNKQIYMSDFDGQNAVQITNTKQPNLSPSWSRDGRTITFTSYEDGNPDLFSYDVATGRKRKLSGRKGLNSGANWAHNNKLIAFTGSVDGDADVYTLKPDGSGTKLFIRGSGLDVDPTFSPDGKWLAYVSGRYGNPHIFIAELKWDGDTAVHVLGDKRLTYAGWYNATPAWTPASDKIAFAGYDRDTDRFDIFLMNPDGTSMERLTIRSGDNERPSWSPNGQMVVFNSNRTQGKDVKSVHQLFVMNRDGTNQRALNTGLYEAQTPQWGPPQE